MDPTETGDAIEPTDVQTDLGAGGGEAHEAPEFEYPDSWTKETKAAVESMLGHPEGRKWADQYRNQWQSAEEQQRKLQSDRDRYRAHAEQWGKWQQSLAPYEQQFRMYGIPLESGVMQALEWSKAIQSNPKQALQQLAQMYAVDFSKPAEGTDEPYVDPYVKQLEQRYQRDIGGIQQALQGVMGHFQQQTVQQAVSQIEAFANATDESGAPSHPYFNDLDENELIRLVNAGYPLEKAYQIACMSNEDVAKKIAADKAKKDAAARRSDAEKAAGAAKALSPAGKAATSKPKAPRTAREAIEMAERELSG